MLPWTLASPMGSACFLLVWGGLIAGFLGLVRHLLGPGRDEGLVRRHESPPARQVPVFFSGPKEQTLQAGEPSPRSGTVRCARCSLEIAVTARQVLGPCLGCGSTAFSVVL